MKLEFLAEGSDDCPLIRLYDFDMAGALRLREAFRALADGSRSSIPLHEEWWIEPVEGCQLHLRIGSRNLGIVERLPMQFDCSLGPERWTELVELIQPFCASTTHGSNVYQWLDEDGEISLLLSPTGQW